MNTGRKKNTDMVKARKRGKMKKYTPLYLLMIPGLLYLVINNYIPMMGLVIAFKDYNFKKGLLGSKWVGFKNFRFLFKTSDAWVITRNTILYNLVFIVVGTIFAIMIAIALNELKSRRLAKIFQTTLILPALISMVVVAILVNSLLNFDSGIMNKYVLPLFGADPVSWYTKKEAWPFILVIVYLWKNAGYQCVIFLAAIVGINKEFYESAKIDGATKWQQIRYITLPLIKPTIIMVVVLALGKIFYSDFGLFYQVPMNGGALFSVTSTIDTYVYNGLLKLGDIGLSSAAGFYQSIVGFVLILTANLIIRKYDKESALF